MNGGDDFWSGNISAGLEEMQRVKGIFCPLETRKISLGKQGSIDELVTLL